MIIAICLILYFLGFFLTAGLFVGISVSKGDFDIGTVIVALIFGILSWLGFGFILGLRMMDR